MQKQTNDPPSAHLLTIMALLASYQRRCNNSSDQGKCYTSGVQALGSVKQAGEKEQTFVY